MQPIRDNKAYVPAVMTRWIACRIVSHADLGAKERGYKIFQSLSHQSSLRSSAGWFFELYTHNWLRKGGRFVADLLSRKDSEEELSFYIDPAHNKEARFFTTSADLANQLKKQGGRGVDNMQIRVYFQPRCRNQEFFDGLMVKTQDMLILFQITMASTHEIKVGGVRDILQELPKTIKTVCDVFTIPADRADNYKKPQKAPVSEDLTINNHEYTIKQYRLVFPDDDVLSIAVPRQPRAVSKGKRKRRE